MKVICISGKAGHGKDTAANYMKTILDHEGSRALIIHYADLLKYLCKALYGWNGEKDEYGRSLLQYVGTDIVRKKDQNYWVNFVISVLTLFHDEWDYVIIPDCRFPNEVDLLRQQGFDVCAVRVVRDKYDDTLTDSQSAHPSEIAMDTYKFDYVIRNTDFPSFYHKLDDLIEAVKGA